MLSFLNATCWNEPVIYVYMSLYCIISSHEMHKRGLTPYSLIHFISFTELMFPHEQKHPATSPDIMCFTQSSKVFPPETHFAFILDLIDWSYWLLLWILMFGSCYYNSTSPQSLQLWSTVWPMRSIHKLVLCSQLYKVFSEHRPCAATWNILLLHRAETTQ